MDSDPEPEPDPSPNPGPYPYHCMMPDPDSHTAMAATELANVTQDDEEAAESGDAVSTLSEKKQQRVAKQRAAIRRNKVSPLCNISAPTVED